MAELRLPAQQRIIRPGCRAPAGPESPDQSMYLEEIGRHLAVSSIPELEKSLKRDRGFWNIVSIREPNVRKPEFLCHARSYVEILCEDTERADHEHSVRPPRPEDVARIFEFLDRHPGEPVLVHCFAGLSRSTAVALAIIVKCLGYSGNLMAGLSQKGKSF